MQALYPTLDSLLLTAKEKGLFGGGRATRWRILHKMGFRHKFNDKRYIYEQPSTIYQRHAYLQCTYEQWRHTYMYLQCTYEQRRYAYLQCTYEQWRHAYLQCTYEQWRHAHLQCTYEQWRHTYLQCTYEQ